MLRSKETKLTFSYGINPRTTVTIGTNGASVTWSNGTITSNTGTTPPQSFAGLQGTMPVIFAGTENVSAIFTASFSSTPVAGTTSVVGFGDTEYGIFVGYNGTQQGVCLAQNGLAQYYFLSLSGSVTVAGTLNLSLNGVTYTISIPVGLAVQDVVNLLQSSTTIASGNYFVRQFGMGVHIWSIAAQPVSAQPSVTLTGVTGMTASISLLQNGALGTQNWISTNQWNGVVNSITPINWTAMNTFKIETTPLGYGVITWSILDPVSQSFAVIHTLSNANASNPLVLPTGIVPACLSTNGANNSVMQVSTSGFTCKGGALFDMAADLPPYTISNTWQGTTTTTSATNLVYLHNPIFGTVLRNHKSLVLRSAVISVATTNNVLIEIRQNSQISHAVSLSQPAQLTAGSSAYVSYDSTVNISGGLVLRSIPFAPAAPTAGSSLASALSTPANYQLVVSLEGFFVAPSTWLTVSVIALSGSTQCSAGIELTWTER